MPRRSLLTLSVLLALGFATLAQQAGQPSFQTLLDRAKREDAQLDFKALRLAYTETPLYDPYDSAPQLQTAILKALREKQYEQCLGYADKALQKNFVDSNVHFAAYRAHTALHNQARAKFHRYMMDGLLKSILASGDGKTPASAFMVISTEEEYALLDAVGLRRVSQSLVKQEGHVYDLIVAREESGAKEVRLYFNIDRQFGWLRQRLEKGMK